MRLFICRVLITWCYGIFYLIKKYLFPAIPSLASWWGAFHGARRKSSHDYLLAQTVRPALSASFANDAGHWSFPEILRQTDVKSKITVSDKVCFYSTSLAMLLTHTYTHVHAQDIIVFSWKLTFLQVVSFQDYLK